MTNFLDVVFEAPIAYIDSDKDLVGSTEPPEETPAVPAPELPFREITHVWHGTDGSVWDLSNPETGVFMMQENVEGLHHPPVDMIRRESPSLPGSSFHGYRVKERPVVWPLYVYSDESSLHFADLDTRLWNSLQIGKEGTWEVILPDGSSRQLRMRISASPMAFDRDPVRFGWQRYAVEAVADLNPFWTVPTLVAGTEITWRTGGSEDDNFFGGAAGMAPPMKIIESGVQKLKHYTNPGDEPVWPKIIVTGPMQRVEVRIDEHVFTITTPTLTDQSKSLTITTDPRYFSVVDQDGANRIKDLSTWSFEPLPAGKQIPMEVTPYGDGGGSVVFDVTPLYHRAWGVRR